LKDIDYEKVKIMDWLISLALKYMINEGKIGKIRRGYSPLRRLFLNGLDTSK